MELILVYHGGVSPTSYKAAGVLPVNDHGHDHSTHISVDIVIQNPILYENRKQVDYTIEFP